MIMACSSINLNFKKLDDLQNDLTLYKLILKKENKINKRTIYYEQQFMKAIKAGASFRRKTHL